jgi:transcriptional regulator with XRE-family HTH domain
MGKRISIMGKPGEWILRHRKAKGLRQWDVAQRAGVSVSYISTLERGQKHSETNVDIQPDREKVIAIAKAVGGNPDELLLLYEFAPSTATTKPQTVAELLEAIERLGVDHIMFAEDLNDMTPNDLSDILDSIRNSIEHQLLRKKRKEM